MDFKDQIQQLADNIGKLKDSIATEEATKNAFIMPMIVALGYDVFNPHEVIPEMDCDLTKRGDKIDYAIMKGEKPVLIMECKHCRQNLDLHDTQLAKYFAASNTRFGVLTNGIEYRFYADLEKANIMDKKPFFVVNMLDLSDADMEQLKKFHKSYYDEAEILGTAQEQQITIQIKELLAKNFQSPGDEFTRYFVRCLNNWKSTSKLIEQYRPLVKESVESVINDMITDRLKGAMKGGGPQPAPETRNGTGGLPEGVASMDKERGIVTTQEELDAYNIVRSILRRSIDVSLIKYKDFKSYFVVNLNDSAWAWICRISISSRMKRIGIPSDHYASNEWIQIDSIDDIFKYADRLEEALKMAMKLQHID